MLVNARRILATPNLTESTFEALDNCIAHLGVRNVAIVVSLDTGCNVLTRVPRWMSHLTEPEADVLGYLGDYKGVRVLTNDADSRVYDTGNEEWLVKNGWLELREVSGG